MESITQFLFMILPVTEEIVEEVLSLPIHAKLTKDDLDYIIKVIKEFFE